MDYRRTLQKFFDVCRFTSLRPAQSRKGRKQSFVRPNPPTEQLEVRRVLTTIDLASLIASQGSIAYGADFGDQSGFSVSNVGDVNKDGFEDILIGVPFSSGAGNAGTTVGEAVLVFGSASLPGTINLASPGSAATVIYGIDPEDVAGWSVSGAGDVNGDGFADVLIGAVAADGVSNSKSGAGETYVVFGRANMPASLSLNTLGTNGTVLFGSSFTHGIGNTVSDAGDVNGDGCDDLLVGTTQADKSYLVYGRPSMPTTIDLGSLGAAGVTMSPGQNFSLSSAGDVNGDGYDDILVGDPAFSAGRCRVIFGSNSLPNTLNVTAPGSLGFTLSGQDSGDDTGVSVSSAGDVNGDGFDDLLIGADLADGAANSTSDSGQCYVVYGAATFPSTVTLGSLGTGGVTIFGVDADDYSGFSVSGAGDANGDGFDDILIGAFFADATGNSKADAGESYLIFGGSTLPTTLNLSTLGARGITIVGTDTNDQSGHSVSGAGDVNGDGFSDLLIGADRGDGAANNRVSSGESYILFGGDFSAAVTHTGTDAGETLAGNGTANVMIGGRGNDVLLGNGGADVLQGGQGNDTIAVTDLLFRRVEGGTGSDTLRIDGSGLSLDLSMVNTNRISGIEEIDLTGTGDNLLTLTVREILNLSPESNTLLVRSNTGDTVNIGSGWTALAAEVIGPDRFRVYSQGQAILKLQDSTPPTASIVVADTSLLANETSLVTITFSEAVTDFTNADLSVANGTLSNVVTTDGGVTWTATLTPADNLTDSTNIITLNNTTITDTAGLAGIGTTDSNNYAIDTHRPSATIVVADSSLAIAETSLVTITFSEVVSGFENDDLNISNGTLSSVATSDGGLTWTATLTPSADTFDITNVFVLSNAGVQNSVGNSGTGTTTSNNYAIDTLRPTVIIDVAESVLSTVQTSLVTFTFSEPVTGFDNLDIQVANGVLSTVISNDGGITWTATLTPDNNVADSTNSVSVVMSGVNDAAGNSGTGTTNSDNYSIDTQRPAASILLADPSLRVGETSLVTITFSEAVTNFSNTDVQVVNGTLTGFSSTDGGITWSATLTPAANTSDTTNVITLDNTGVTDAAGNAGIGNTVSPNYEVLTLRPTATVTMADTTLIAGETSLVTIQFSEIVSGFSNADVTVPNGTLADVTTTDSGKTWTAVYSPGADVLDTSNSISVNLVGVTNALGNTGTGSATSANFVIDTQRPTVSIVVADDLLTVGQSSLVTMTFSEPVVGFANDDIVVPNGTLSTVTSANGGLTWTATLTPTSGIADATNVISIDNAGLSDVRGNHGINSTVSNNYAVETQPPTAKVVVSPAILKVGQTATVTITFSEAVSGFTVADLTAANGTLSALASSNGGVTWTATLTPANGILDSSNVVVLDKAGVTDLSGNVGAGTTSSGNYSVNTKLIEGTSLNDVFVFSFQGTTPSGIFTVTVSSNGGPTRSLGSFPMNVAMTLNGLDGTDSLRVNTTAGNDTFVVSGGTLQTNGSGLTLTSVETRLLAGAAGNDTYRFDADVSLGNFSLDESGGGIDTLDFSSTSTVALDVNLGTASLQLVHASNLGLELKSSSTFENVIGGSGNDTILGNSLPNTISGGNGGDRITGSGGSDTMNGGLGDDIYFFAAAALSENDIVAELSDQGIDTLDFSAITSDVTMNLASNLVQTVHSKRTVKLNSSATVENVFGGSANDTLSGNTLANTLKGNSGNDNLTGSGNSDALYGGIGDDTYTFANAASSEADLVYEQADEGTDALNFSTATTSITVALSSNLTQTVQTNRTIRLNSGVTLENANGGTASDTLTGNTRSNVLNGNDGNDVLNGAGADDTMAGGRGDDIYVFAAAASFESDTLSEAANTGTDTLDFSALTTAVTINLALNQSQNVHNNRTIALNSSSTFENATGGIGSDWLNGNSVANTLIGNGGHDILVGNSGNDVLIGDTGRDLLIGGLGLDTINGGNDDDILIAGRTVHDAFFITLSDIRTAWISGSTYATRVSRLRSGTASSGPTLRAKVDVLNDAGDDDQLTGGSSTDWYFRAVDDVLSDLFTGEAIELL